MAHPQALVVFLIACGAAAETWLEPYPYVTNGSLVPAPVGSEESPDPQIVNGSMWAWDASSVTASSGLQVFFSLPLSLSPCAGTPSDSIINAESLLAWNATASVIGPFACLRFDFGAVHAAWLEVHTPSPLPAADAASLVLAISEYDQFGVYNSHYYKFAAPRGYVYDNGSALYRLELHSDALDYYEGVRFAWLFFNSSSAPSAAINLTCVRLVSQIKPSNYSGAFSLTNDSLTTRVWWTAAYTVKVTLQATFFGTILMYRGDRFSWTGDAHVAQATAMAALGNWDFIAANIALTANESNGIESYSLYWVLSELEYWRATGDDATLTSYVANIAGKLGHAYSIWPTVDALGFEGWDDRLGSGFQDPRIPEAQNDYRMIAIRAFNESAAAMAAIGQNALATVFAGYAADAIAIVRSAGAQWYADYGLFASADAICAGFATEEEVQAMVSLQFNDTVTVCGLSPFNTYWILQAIARAGQLDRGLAVLRRCWGGFIQLGATTTWEVFSPDWLNFIPPTGAIPGFEDGYTSMTHPWSTGAAPWLTRNIAGVTPLSPGFVHVLIAPHIDTVGSGVRAAVPTPHGVLRVAATPDGVQLTIPAGIHTAELRLSLLLLQRLHSVCGSSETWTYTHTHDGSVTATAAPLRMMPHPEAPWDELARARTVIATLRLSAGEHTLNFSSSSVCKDVQVADPFPPAVYPATFVGADTTTSGSWIGKYGSDGYYLLSFDGAGKHRVQLPAYITAVTNTFNTATDFVWSTGTNDPRALQDPAAPSGPRKLGYRAPPPNGNPSFACDITVAPQQPNSTFTWQLAVYVVDYDSDAGGDVPTDSERGVIEDADVNYVPGVLGPRRQTVTLLDGDTLNPISPRQFVGDFVNGVWLVWNYTRSVRLRFDNVRAQNEVVSALAFGPSTGAQ